MKKLTAGIFATLLAVVSVDGAYAAIASKGYVDDQVGEVQTAVTAVEGNVSTLQTTVGQHTTQIAGKADSSTVTALGGRVDAAEGEIDTLQTEVGGKQDALGFTPENSANKTQTVNAQSTDVQYPSAKAVWTAVSSVDANASVEALEGRVETLETASATHATKTELTDGLAEKLDTETAATTYATKTELAGKQNTIVGAQLEALNSGITADKVEAYDGYAAQISGKLDTATADGKYAVKSTEGVANTASTNAQSALTNIGTLSQLTTDAKGNTVAAINEVAKEAADAQSTATGAQSAVDAVESTIGGYGDIVSHDASEFATTGALTSGLAGKLDSDATAARATADASGNVITTTYATKAEIANMATDENLALKQDKTDEGLETTNKTVVGAINEVRGTANTANSTATAAEVAAEAAQEDATQALEDAAAAQSAAEAAQTAADSKLPTATYNSQVGTVSATNMGTTATTVVAAIKEVAGEAAAAQSTASSANTAAGEAQEAAEAAQATANAAIPKPDGECSNPANKCVLTFNNSVYAWEVIERGAAE